MDCGDLAHGFARVRCDHCAHEYLLAFSCKGRWFCPSCHQKKVQLFGALVTETILFPVPHRHFTFTIPKMTKSLSLPKGCACTFIRPHVAQGVLPSRPCVSGRIHADRLGPAGQPPRRCHVHSQLRRISGLPPAPARARGRRTYHTRRPFPCHAGCQSRAAGGVVPGSGDCVSDDTYKSDDRPVYCKGCAFGLRCILLIVGGSITEENVPWRQHFRSCRRMGSSGMGCCGRSRSPSDAGLPWSAP